MNSIRIIGIIGIVTIATVFLLSIPEEPDYAKIQRVSDIIGVSPEDIVNEAESQLLFQNIFPDEPDFVIEDVKVFVDEIAEPPKAKSFELERTFTFDDGTFQKDIVKASLLEQVNLSGLDFVALKNDERSLSNGSINLKLTVKVDKEIERAEGEFVIFFGSNKDIVSTISLHLNHADVVDSNLLVFDRTIQLSNLLASKSEGIHTLELRLDELFIIYKDNSREFANPSQILYTIDFEKNIAKSIIKNEEGKNMKIFDFDVPITISANPQIVLSGFCNTYYKAGGCASSYSRETFIPAPALGSVTITDKAGKIVAEKPAKSAGYCLINAGRYLYGSSDCVSVEPSAGGGSLSFNAQRGESYKITVSDPVKSWTVNVPESGGSFSFSCVESQGFVRTGLTLSGVEIYSIVSYGRQCNFP